MSRPVKLHGVVRRAKRLLIFSTRSIRYRHKKTYTVNPLVFVNTFYTNGYIQFLTHYSCVEV
ncbi:hypothetical protein MNBD_CPR01-577 [hydrothermal vent metagenome]|uniref:Uncharacterized protein n=1 Tax=hydrothermal vent metagenome TaxID=652676 RepID=A0A3B0VJS6_9ZZZZ